MAKHFDLGGRVLSKMHMSLRTLRDEVDDDVTVSEMVLVGCCGFFSLVDLCAAAVARVASRAR